MKTRLIKSYNRFLAFLISILGFSSLYSIISCDNTSTVEYGNPYAKFKVKGYVTNSSETPVKGIRITMETDTAFTNDSGKFQIETTSFPQEQAFLLNFTDIDKGLNDEYLPADTTVKFDNPQFENGDGDWYEGVVEKELRIRLNRK